MRQPKIYPLAILLASGLFWSAFAAPTSHTIKRTPQPQGTSELDPSELVVIPIDDSTDPLTVGTPSTEPDPITAVPSTDTGGSNGVPAPGSVAVRDIHSSPSSGKRAPHPEPRPQTEGVTSSSSISSASNIAGLDPSELVVIPIDDPALSPVDNSGVAGGFKVRARMVRKAF